MKTLDTTPGSEYAVKSAAGCDVYTPSGQVLCRIMPGILGSFCASSYVTCFSDAAAEVTLVSSGAPGGTGGDTLTISQALAAANRAESAADRAEAGASAAELQAQGATVANSAAQAALAGAKAAETNAKAAAQAAATSEGNATAAAQASATSEANAAASAQASATSEANATASADRAETAQVAAQASENKAADSADLAAAAQAAAELAAATAQAPESLAVQAARPATMVLLRGELEALLGSSVAWLVDTDGQKIVVHTDRLAAEQLAAVEDVLARFVPGFIGLRQYNHDFSIPWQELPEGFTVVDWLESVGKQYFSFKKNIGTTEDDTEIIFTKLTISSYGGILSLISVPPAEFKSAEIQFNSNPRNTHSEALFQTCYYDADGTYTSPSKTGVCGYFYLNSNGQDVARFSERKCYFNDEYKGVIDTEYKLPVSPLAAITALGWDFSARIFGLKHKSNETGELLLNLIPCVDDTGAPCMLDRVTRTIYYNAGSGDFLYPGKEEEPTTYSLRRPITYAQLTEYGVRRLYHVPNGYNGTVEEYAAEHGWLPLVETEPPEEGYWAPEWRETEDEIVLEWVPTTPPEEILTATE